MKHGEPSWLGSLQMRGPSAPVVAEVIATFAQNAIVKILSGSFSGRTGRVLQSAPRSTRIALEAFSGRETIVALSTEALVLV